MNVLTSSRHIQQCPSTTDQFVAGFLWFGFGLPLTLTLDTLLTRFYKSMCVPALLIAS